MPKVITETSESGAVRARYIISSSSSSSSGSIGGGGGDGWRTEIVVRTCVLVLRGFFFSQILPSRSGLINMRGVCQSQACNKNILPLSFFFPFLFSGIHVGSLKFLFCVYLEPCIFISCAGFFSRAGAASGGLEAKKKKATLRGATKCPWLFRPFRDLIQDHWVG